MTIEQKPEYDADGNLLPPDCDCTPFGRASREEDTLAAFCDCTNWTYDPHAKVWVGRVYS